MRSALLFTQECRLAYSKGETVEVAVRTDHCVTRRVGFAVEDTVDIESLGYCPFYS